MIDVVSGKAGEQDWTQVWLDSDENKALQEEIASLNSEAKEKSSSVDNQADSKYASSLPRQCRLVSRRANTQVRSHWLDLSC
jgi:hypothetical protein